MVLLKDKPEPRPEDRDEQLLDDRDDKVQETEGSVKSDKTGSCPRSSPSPNNSSLTSSVKVIRLKIGQRSIRSMM